jgi:hypothetical protein
VSDATQPSNAPNLARRTRGRGFPIVPLDEAADIVRRAGKYGHSHAEQAFASYMGHTTTNSGAFKQRFAAMRSWGLISVERGEVQLTDMGRRVAYPVSEADAYLALQEAFMHAAVFAELYATSAKGEELDTNILANRAVHTLGISPKSTSKFAQVFARSAVAAGYASEAAPGKLELHAELPLDPIDPIDSGHTPPPVDPPGAGDVPAERPRPGRARETSPVIAQAWPVLGGEISFEVSLDRPLPARALAGIAEIFEAIERLVDQLGGSEDPTS